MLSVNSNLISTSKQQKAFAFKRTPKSTIEQALKKPRKRRSNFEKNLVKKWNKIIERMPTFKCQCDKIASMDEGLLSDLLDYFV